MTDTVRLRTFANVLGDSKCECCDSLCPAHDGQNECSQVGSTMLYRVDMEDNSGTIFCDDCANDATMSGLFAEYDDPSVFCRTCGAGLAHSELEHNGECATCSNETLDAGLALILAGETQQ